MTVTVNLTSPYFAAIATGVGACVVEALEQTPAGAPDRQCLLLPTFVIPWDHCDCGGQVALAIRRTFASTNFPTEAPYANGWAHPPGCGPRYQAADVLVSVTRCVPGMSQDGEPPSCNAYLAAALTLENDRIATRQAIACCLQQMKTAHPPTLGVQAFTIGPSVTVGEQGGCAGVETIFTVGVNACACPGG